jgi:hypothetical protein
MNETTLLNVRPATTEEKESASLAEGMMLVDALFPGVGRTTMIIETEPGTAVTLEQFIGALSDRGALDLDEGRQVATAINGEIEFNGGRTLQPGDEVAATRRRKLG